MGKNPEVKIEADTGKLLDAMKRCREAMYGKSKPLPKLSAKIHPANWHKR